MSDRPWKSDYGRWNEYALAVTEAWEPMTGSVKRGFVDKTTWDHEADWTDFRIYDSEADLLKEWECANECGIVEIEMRLIRVVKESKI